MSSFTKTVLSLLVECECCVHVMQQVQEHTHTVHAEQQTVPCTSLDFPLNTDFWQFHCSYTIIYNTCIVIIIVYV